jgi:glyoxylase-like metal-dependent hydrolase (beta-lactamase superfamily II)
LRLPVTFIALFVTGLFSLPASAAPKIYVFDCGSIDMTDVADFGLSNQETDVRTLFVPCYLIENNGKRLFWDGGLPLNLVGSKDLELEAGMKVSYPRSVLDQLQDINLTPAAIDLVAFSHFHFDHIGAADAFAASTLLINKREYTAAFLQADEYEIFDPTLYSKLADAERVELTDDDYDVFGDGSVILIAAPGHTPGHQVLLVKLENTGPILLSGDLYHFEFNRRHQRVPAFNTDREQTLEAMQKIEQRLHQEGATLWLEHSQALADSLNLAPAFYD